VQLNSTSAVILGLLHDGSATGGDIVAAAERRLVAQGGVTRSQVYRELPQLVRDGLVEATSEYDVPGRRASQAYALTAAGRRAFAAWALMPATADSVRSAAVLRLGFGAHLTPAQRKEIIAAALVEHELALAEHEQRAKDIRAEGDEFAASAADFAVAYERAFLTWLRGFPT
jgi:DNA-binding PadR family transcriptional regulator